MKHFVSLLCAFTIISACFFWSTNADAQRYYNKRSGSNAAPSVTDKMPSNVSINHAERVSKFCPEHWETQECLSAVSESNLVLAANYAGVLEKRGKKSHLENLKQHCAAATAGSKGEYPAYAMRSAFVECANIIVDISDATGIDPDKSHYQLLVGAVLCLDEDRRCDAVEQGLMRY